MKGIITNIQRLSLDDGPGIRTTVFFKGCPLNCLWCHNPENIAREIQIQYKKSFCHACGACMALCPKKAVSDNDGEKVFDRSKCDLCGICVQNCLHNALTIAGKEYTTDELLEEVLKDELFYKNSGGGVTVSGGEPLVWADFMKEFFEKAKAAGLTTTVDTCGMVDWSAFEKVLPLTDLFLYDIKALSGELHKQLTGSSNELILENLEKLSAAGANIWIRIPLIDGVNDQEAEQIADRISGLKGISQVDLLAYHAMGESKYESIGLHYDHDFKKPSAERMQELVEYFNQKGLNAFARNH